jgi:peptidyl-prolyl cis-trans isomerase SurA
MKLLRVFILLVGVSLVTCAGVEAASSSDDESASQVGVEPEIVAVPKKDASPLKVSPKPKTCIVVIVNKDVITAADVDERVRLINLSAGKPVSTPIPDDLRKQIIQGMVEEALQLQAAKSKKIKVEEADVEKALETLAKDNKMSLEAMVKMLRTNGISKQTMLTRLRAQMAWGRFVREMYGPLVHIRDQEVDKVLSQAKEVKLEPPSPDEMELTLCQAIFDVSPQSPEEVMMIMGPKIEETHQAKGCPAFLKAASGFGAKVDANRVVKLGQLPGSLKTLVQKAKAGTCMQPTMTPDGLVLTMVCSKKMPQVAPLTEPARDMASNAVEQEKLGKRAAQEMAKLKSVAFIEWK